MLRSKKYQKKISLCTAVWTLAVVLSWSLTGWVWNKWDYGLLDRFYQRAVEQQRGPQSSGHIVYLAVTDETYEYLGKNHLDRHMMARANRALAELGPRAVGFDIIFSRPSQPEPDLDFEQSIRDLGHAYLPMAFDLADTPQPFRWEEGRAFDRLKQSLQNFASETGSPHPYFGTRALMQMEEFADATFNFGHINASSNSDGIYRHLPLLIKVDDGWSPTLPLAMFLDNASISIDRLEVDWGTALRIPAVAGSPLTRDLVIPIDDRGSMFIPFTQVWGKDYPAMTVHTFLKLYQDETLRGNLTEFFEDKFVFVTDISQGVHDLGQTPLESQVPLVSIHTSALNAMLNDTFYDTWSLPELILFIVPAALLIGFAAWFRSSWVLHGTFLSLLLFFVGWTWVQFTQFSLFPIASITFSLALIYLSLLIVSEVSVSKDGAELHNAFSKFLPAAVMDHLLAEPDRLQLGGEEKVLTVLFMDIAGFTTISEKLNPSDLVDLLNRYFTDMGRIIQEENGIIDKFLGDAIMAEFGAPVPQADHADRAVNAALKMHRRVRQLQSQWKEKGVPELTCRVGINTGPMIIGNMGSQQAFDYTVIGDAVNLASRLEGANKFYGTQLMISESTYRELTPGKFQSRLLDFIKVKGKSEAVRVYEVFGTASDPQKEHDMAYYRHYVSGIEALIAGNLEQALPQLSMAQLQRPEDLACRNMMRRIGELNPGEITSNGEGSFALADK